MSTWPIKPAHSVLVVSEFADSEDSCVVRILDYPTAVLTLSDILHLQSFLTSKQDTLGK